MKEIWRDILNYEGLYEVSSLGRVRRIKNKRLTTFYIDKEYYFVYLFKNNKRTQHSVHILVAEAFLGHVRCGMSQVVDHKDGDKSNNKADNLRVVTQRQNMHFHYGEDVGVHLRGKRWYSRIFIDGKQKYLGSFDTKQEAIKARNTAIELENQGKSNEIKVPKPIMHSNYKGVTFDKTRNKWLARVKGKNLGRFSSEAEAYAVTLD